MHPSIGCVDNYTGTTRVEDQMSEDVLAARNRVQISLNKFITRKRSELKSLNWNFVNKISDIKWTKMTINFSADKDWPPEFLDYDKNDILYWQ